MSSLVLCAKANAVESSARFTEPTSTIRPATVDHHFGFPSLVKYDDKLYMAARESHSPVGHHRDGFLVIYESTDEGSSWRKIHTLLPPRLGDAGNINDVYNANDVRDFTLSVKPAFGNDDEKLTLTMVAVNTNEGAIITREFCSGRPCSEQDLICSEENKCTRTDDRVQFSVYSEYDPTVGSWSPYQKLNGANDDYWFYSTKWVGNTSYSLALLAGPLSPILTFTTGGVVQFSSLDGINYTPNELIIDDPTSKQATIGGLRTPYANAVSARDKDNVAVGANETDFVFLDDGSIVAVSRKFMNEKSYFFGYAKSASSKWTFTEIDFPDSNNNNIGVHGMELLKLDSGIILATYRRLNLREIPDSESKVEEYRTVISWLNPQTGVLKEVAVVNAIDHFDIGYPAMLVDENNFYFAQYQVYKSGGPFEGMGSYQGPNVSEISFFRVPLEELYKEISASMYAELEPLRQYLNN